MKWPLLPGVTGDAIFAGDRREHRLLLMRRWDDLGTRHAGAALWIGMNPSGAEADIDDLTIRKEQTWTRMLGLSQYLKMNIGTYRWTDSLTLPEGGLVHKDNLTMIRAHASTAATIILTTGKPPDVLMSAFEHVRWALKRDGRKVKCLGPTKDGWPKHSSRVGYSTPMVEFVL
jgi:hypothetical protein